MIADERSNQKVIADWIRLVAQTDETFPLDVDAFSCRITEALAEAGRFRDDGPFYISLQEQDQRAIWSVIPWSIEHPRILCPDSRLFIARADDTVRIIDALEAQR